MRKLNLLMALFLILPPFLSPGQEKAAKPITAVNVQSMGPQKLGNLPPVAVPINNQQSTLKIQLGKKLYFDTRLSKDNTISCATCHNPAMGWSDAGPTSVGIRGQKGGRRAPPVSNAAYAPLQFWDGRAPSLEEQAKGPIANPIEMGNTHELMIQSLQGIAGYVKDFERVWGSSIVTIDMAAEAIAAFERTVVTTDSPFDRYARGDENALTKAEKQGLEIFNGKGHCTACHWGSYFSDGRFHNLGVQPADISKQDAGRYAVTKDTADMGAFKTPTIRDVGLRAPYMHDGSEKSLEDVVDLYNKGGRTHNCNLSPLIVPLGLTKCEKKALITFMKTAMKSINPEVADVKPVPASELPK